jgi:hypothetical protein
MSYRNVAFCPSRSRSCMRCWQTRCVEGRRSVRCASQRFKSEIPDEWPSGAKYYPVNTRNLRMNLHVIRVFSSRVSSVFGYYVGWQYGTTVSVGTLVFF